MSNAKKVTINIILCLIIMAIVLVVFFIGFSNVSKTRFDYIRLTFVLISVVVLFTGFTLLSMNSDSKNKTLIRVGIGTTLSGYLILTTISSLLWRTVLNDNIDGFVTTQIIIIGVTAIACIIIMTFSGLQSNNEKRMSSRKWLQDGENIIFSLKNDVKLEAYNKQLEELYETIKYSDKIATNIELDKRINGEITQLSNYLKSKELSESEAIQCLEKVISMLKERNKITLESKRGAY